MITTRTHKDISYKVRCYDQVHLFQITVFTITQGSKILQTLQSDKLKRLSLKAVLEYNISIEEDPLYNIVIFTVDITPEESDSLLDSTLLVKKFTNNVEEIEKNIEL